MKFSAHSIILLVVFHLFGGCSKNSLPEVPADAKGTAEAVINNLAESNPGILWSALPASYQNDVNDLVRSAVKVVDKDLYNEFAGLLRKANKILREKKSFLLKAPQLGLMAKDLDEVSKNWDAITKGIDIILDSQLGSFERAQNFDGGDFLADTGTDLMRHMVTISSLTSDDPWTNEMLPEFKGVTIKEVSSSERKTVLEFTDLAGQTDPINFVRVEGKWIPEDMTVGWAEGIEALKAELPNKSDLMAAQMSTRLIIGMVKGVLDQLDKATNEAEFLKVLEGLGNL